jgi:methionyl-tRNA formyltransferase
MKFSVMGIERSKYFLSMLESIINSGLIPEYVIIEDHNIKNLANSVFFIDNRVLNTHEKDCWDYDEHDSTSIVTLCLHNSIPFFVVSSQNGRYTQSILENHPVDLLLITEGPIIRGNILYKPAYCVMSIHAAPLPQYRGNWTTRLSIYNDEPPFVTAHVVVPWIDEGAVINKASYNIEENDTMEIIDQKATNAAIKLAVDTIKKIETQGFEAKIQRIWEGQEYKGRFENGKLMPAMPYEIQEELDRRLLNCEYGFYNYKRQEE